MKSVFPFLVLLTFAVACVEPIVMDPMEEMPVVVQCVLTRESNSLNDDPEPTKQYLDLYYARRPGEVAPTPIDNAIVVVRDLTESNWNNNYKGDAYTFSWNGSRWEAAFTPSFGGQYTLEIQVPGRSQHIKASTTFPADCYVQGKSIQLPAPYPLYDGFYLGMSSSRLNRYYSVMWRFTTREFLYYKDGGSWYSVQDHIGVYPGEVFLWVTATEGGKPVERLFTDHPGVDGFNITEASWDQLKCLPEMKTLDITSRYQQGRTDTFYWDQYERICSELPLHKKFLRIHHPAAFVSSHKGDSLTAYATRDYAQNLFALGADLEYAVDNIHTQDYPYRLTFRFLSREYDLYLRDILNNTEVHGDEFTNLYSAAPGYTNIEGGIGIFGSMITR